MKRESFERPTKGTGTRLGQVPEEPQVLRWSPVTRAAFRFCFAYFGLYCLATQISGGLLVNPSFSFRGLGPLWPLREITFWVGEHVFGFAAPLVYAGNSRDTDFYWVQTFWLLTLAALATGVWSALDRRRESYVTLHQWFRLFIRFGLASQMFEYGMTKVIPTQFPAPSLITLVTPSSNLSLQGFLWTSIGAAPAYEIFTGCAEMLGGILLLVPCTTMLGSMICLAAMTHVFVLNMTYDIGVKLLSFHLVLMTLLLLAPDFSRLVDFFLRDRVVPPSGQYRLFRTRRADRVSLVVQILCGVYLVGMYTYINTSFWYAAGGGSPRSPFYGIWDVSRLSVDGEIREPMLNDYDRRWRRVIFDSPDNMTFQRTDDSFARFGVSIDLNKKTLALTKGNSRHWEAVFTFNRATERQLDLAGEMDGHKIQLQLQLVDFDTLRLLNSGFRWIRPPDQ